MTYVEKLEQLFKGMREPVTIIFRRPTISRPEANHSDEQERDDSSGTLRRNREMLERHQLL
ncbi:hypothetical protein AB4Z34_34560 [Ensifer sp. 2YAB10]|uniref:hypothetical protein n=1 Tax=unclassified Ensifer TaxID=2633371 RepID=UPI003F8F33EC